MLLLIGECLVAYVVVCVLYHRYVRRTGKPVEVSYPTADKSTVTFLALSGDLGTPLVVREVLQEEVYLKHGVSLPGPPAPLHHRHRDRDPLVVDLGCNIGLFAMAVCRHHPRAIVVGAEPVRPLWELAVANTTRFAPRVVVVPVGVGCAEQQDVAFAFDPHISAGASMYEAAITRPMRERRWYEQLAAVLRDNAEAGNLPALPAEWLCKGLAVKGVRWLVLISALPAFTLAFLYLLSGGNHRRVVHGSVTTLAGLLQQAADAASDDDARLAARIAGDGPIDLLKVDVEGAELDVLNGISAEVWPRIEQAVVEVHDIDNRVRDVCDVFGRQGFQHLVVDAEGWASHDLLRIRSVYARRLAPPSAQS